MKAIACAYIRTYNQCSCKALLAWSINQTFYVEIDN